MSLPVAAAETDGVSILDCGDVTDGIAWHNPQNGVIKILNYAGDYEYRTGYGRPTWAGAGNYDGDCVMDIFWYEAWNNGTIKVLTRTGTRVYRSGYGPPTWAGVGDFDGNGYDEIAWYEAGHNGTIKILEHWNSEVDPYDRLYRAGYGAPTWAGVGDFDGNGNDEIAWHEARNNGTIKFLGNEDSNQGAVDRNFRTGYGTPTWAAAGDFDEDSFSEIVWYESWNNGTIKLLSGQSTRTVRTGYSAPTWAGLIADADGKDQIAWYESWNNGTIKIIEPTRDGALHGQYPVPAWAGRGSFPNTNGSGSPPR